MKSSLATVVAAMGILTMGCQSPPTTSNLGDVTMALSLPGGASVNSVSWRVLSATSSVLASGSTNTTNASSTPSFNVSLPAGTGDTVAMTATTDQGVMCTGTSAAFNVIAGQAVTVTVNIVCGDVIADSNLGSLVVHGVLVAGDHCPAVTSWQISPQQTAANGGTIDVSVAATDADTGETVAFAWSASAGSFVAPTAATTQYTRGAAGAQTLSVNLTDNHMPSPCTVNVTFPMVTCQ